MDMKQYTNRLSTTEEEKEKKIKGQKKLMGETSASVMGIHQSGVLTTLYLFFISVGNQS